jgi:hypothetical protein
VNYRLIEGIAVPGDVIWVRRSMLVEDVELSKLA